ncbi:hypothetical protein BOW53_04910 [Solemya pervernicosa gill symbiont]|uniref:LysM domain-containing protein n=2 Tax=Gammaproteobacteria incertae sedis TaxID=118884 RepID=A0A1T2L7X5_9GAMM|nr:peptidoglycan DD-metalloendopeptidase family protein [Candidatus Reidiella endopervernicosa]OOZ41208.1 hypothetical protein BOW53_04910 [Solemya pervernicosa gill symbiont]QKQ27065.1 peptidoglycan DD-metalloendopeptidase family protein [Candidatus Reidiella endopervernicosa]
MSRWLIKTTLIAALMLLQACSGRGELAPVREQGDKPRYQPGTHVVSKGETLYSIAWIYGLDHQTLASRNGIKPPYKIFVDQRISLKRSIATKPAAAKPKSSASKPKRPVTKKSTAKKPIVKKPVAVKKPATKRASVVKKPTRKSYNSNKKVKWHWPHKGRVVSRYSSKAVGKKGISIAGKYGNSVLSAADGKVVYSGNGLKGYGNLIIIKHSKSYLSAYAFNRKLLVKEGQNVRVGQRIAEMGRKGKAAPALYFEIRRNGKPINPQYVLPKSR